jgi:hypothetical protein
MKLTRNSIIYVACMPNSATGGPELLHQLVSKLNKRGINAKIFYLKFRQDPIHPNYKKYIDTYVFDIEDNDENVLIVPETRTFLLYRFQNIQKVIWWLSVDNYFVSRKRLKNRIHSFLGIKKFFRIEDKKHHNDIAFHLLQSRYSEDFLRRFSITNYAYLTDYVRQDFIEKSKSVLPENKEDIVLYYPKKGKNFTRKIIASFPDFKWRPIVNLTPGGVAELIANSKVYIDFGNHPGKDRIPREAAILMNCIITGKRGAAANQDDIPIPEEFKFDDNNKNIAAIGQAIYSCIVNYDIEIQKFEPYQKVIRGQEDLFEREIDKIFQIE